MDDFIAARSQMAMSLAFHIVFSCVGMVMPFMMAIAHYKYLKTKNEIYLDACEFWSKKTIDLIQSTNNIIEEHELDFLNNLPGAILSLIESKSENSLNWSKLYLL